jgi:hypothetical protein
LYEEFQENYNKPDNYVDPIQVEVNEAKEKAEAEIREEIDKLNTMRLKKKKELDVLLRAEREKFLERQRTLKQLNESEAGLLARQKAREEKQTTDLNLSREEEAIKTKQREEFLEKQRLENIRKHKEKESEFNKQLQQFDEKRAKEYEELRSKMSERMENIKKGVTSAQEV